MTFCVEFEEGAEKCEKELPFDINEIFETAALKSLEYTGCPYECEVDLTITDDGHIRELNREFRDKDTPTDVLSFPLLSFEDPGDFSEAETGYADCFNPETGELMLGSIVINMDRAKKQAEEYGHSLKRETAFLIVHSMLHLQGFDHIEEEDRVIMEDAQKTILNEIGIFREEVLEK